MRGVESAQAAYVGSYALAHLLGGGGPLPVVVVRRMAGYLWFDTAYELVLPYVRGHGTWGAAFLAHHLVGLAAHGLAVTNGALRTATSEVYLAELSTPSLHLSWMLKQLGLASGPAFLANGGIGAAAYGPRRPLVGRGARRGRDSFDASRRAPRRRRGSSFGESRRPRRGIVLWRIAAAATRIVL